jgi:hypothetical protein
MTCLVDGQMRRVLAVECRLILLLLLLPSAGSPTPKSNGISG